MQLIYRAQAFDYTIPAVLSYHKPRALNWRFHAPGEVYDNYQFEAERFYVAPRAINWRWCKEFI